MGLANDETISIISQLLVTIIVFLLSRVLRQVDDELRRIQKAGKEVKNELHKQAILLARLEERTRTINGTETRSVKDDDNY